MWHHLLVADESKWWSAQEASEITGLDPETIRSWARNGRVESQKYLLGRRTLVRVSVQDVRREAAISGTYGKGRSVLTPPGPVSQSKVETGREAVLEEVVRRHRSIDEHRAEIERHHRDIERQQREIEELLLRPTSAPHS